MPLESVARGAEFDRVRPIYGALGIYGALWPGGGGFGDFLDCKSLGVSPNSTAATMGSAPKTSIMMTISIGVGISRGPAGRYRKSPTWAVTNGTVRSPAHMP